jgi:hypothetical protein
VIGWLRTRLRNWAAQLRFPRLLLLTAVVFGVNVAIPDVIPFVDEILLGLATVILSRLRVGSPQPPTPKP